MQMGAPLNARKENGRQGDDLALVAWTGRAGSLDRPGTRTIDDRAKAVNPPVGEFGLIVWRRRQWMRAGAFTAGWPSQHVVVVAVRQSASLVRSLAAMQTANLSIGPLTHVTACVLRRAL